MMRFLSIFALITVVGTASTAEAGWGLRNSFGQGIWLVEPHTTVRDPANPDKLVQGCQDYLCYDGNRRKPIDFEVMPYYTFGLISIDLGIVFNMEARNDLGFDFRFRPGVRVFPILGLFVRGYLDMNVAQISAATSSSGAIRASFEGNLGIGVGYQIKLGPWGGFAEVAFAPRLWGNGIWNMPFEIRLGILLEPN